MNRKMRFELKKPNYLKPQLLSSWEEENEVLSNYVRKKAGDKGIIYILEAGCGTEWRLDLNGIQYLLTGVDINKDALDLRKNISKDLDIGILGDLRNIALKDNEYDVIFSSYVLEHIEGVEHVLENFLNWLKPGGGIILRIPNRDSVSGFVTRITPFWFHVLYYKYIRRYKNAGKPGCGPFPVIFDNVVSRKGMHDFCNKRGLIIRAEYARKLAFSGKKPLRLLEFLMIWLLHILSFTVLSRSMILTYIIEKP